MDELIAKLDMAERYVKTLEGRIDYLETVLSDEGIDLEDRDVETEL